MHGRGRAYNAHFRISGQPFDERLQGNCETRTKMLHMADFWADTVVLIDLMKCLSV